MNNCKGVSKTDWVFISAAAVKQHQEGCRTHKGLPDFETIVAMSFAFLKAKGDNYSACSSLIKQI